MIQRSLLRATALGALSFMAEPLSQAKALHPKTANNIEAVISHAAEEFFKSSQQAVGVSIGIFKDGKTDTYNRGTIEKGKAKPPTARTLYPIASITKTFTGTLLAQAVIEKKVKFDDDVRKYLDGDYSNLEFQGRPIQLGYLVNHNSGLPFNLPDIPENRPPFTSPVSAETREMLDHYNRKDFLADLHKVELKTFSRRKIQLFKYRSRVTQYCSGTRLWSALR